MLNVDGKGLTELDSQILKLLNDAFYNNWRYEFEAGSRMDLETFKSKTFFHLQSLEDMPVDVDYDLVEKFIESADIRTGYSDPENASTTVELLIKQNVISSPLSHES